MANAVTILTIVPVHYAGQLTLTDKDWVRAQIQGDNIADYLIDQGLDWLDARESISVVETIVGGS